MAVFLCKCQGCSALNLFYTRPFAATNIVVTTLYRVPLEILLLFNNTLEVKYILILINLKMKYNVVIIKIIKTKVLTNLATFYTENH